MKKESKKRKNPANPKLIGVREIKRDIKVTEEKPRIREIKPEDRSPEDIEEDFQDSVSSDSSNNFFQSSIQASPSLMFSNSDNPIQNLERDLIPTPTGKSGEEAEKTVSYDGMNYENSIYQQGAYAMSEVQEKGTVRDSSTGLSLLRTADFPSTSQQRPINLPDFRRTINDGFYDNSDIDEEVRYKTLIEKQEKRKDKLPFEN